MQASSVKQKGLADRSDLPAAGIALLIKGKALLFSLFKLKFLFTLVTGVISVFAYAPNFGVAGATGFVILLFVHEMGHVLVLRSQGVPATVPLFIPFVGAIIGMKAFPRGVVDEAYTAIAGPLMGSAGAFVCLVMYFVTGLQMWAWLAYVGFFLNLFNLLPMSPLDGGRIVGAVWRGFWIIGVVAAVAVATWLDSPVLLLFSVFGLSEINRRFMRVHWSAYALLGVLAIVASALCDELLLGCIIAFFAYSHARKAQMLNRAIDLSGKKSQTYTIVVFANGCRLTFTDPIRTELLDSFKQRLKAGLDARIPGRPIRRYLKPVLQTPNGTGAKYFAVPKHQKVIIGSMYMGLSLVLICIVCWMHYAGLFERPQPSSHHNKPKTAPADKSE